MKISGNLPLFTSNYKPAAKTENQNSFSAILEDKLTNTTVEEQRAADLTDAIKALDKALEQADKEKSVELSETLLNWLKDKHNSSDMSIQRKNVERTVHPNGDVQEVSMGGGFSFNEEYNTLLEDLHELGILSDRDMEILNSNYLTMIDPSTLVNGKIMRVEELPFHHRFFNETINPNWSKDISGFNKAMAERYLNAFNYNFGRDVYNENPLLPPDNNWYEEAADVHNHLADVLDQLFKN